MKASSWRTPGGSQWSSIYHAFAVKAARGWERRQLQTLDDALRFPSIPTPHSLFVLDEGQGQAARCGHHAPWMLYEREAHPVLGACWRVTDPVTPSPQEYHVGASLLARLLVGLPKVSGHWLFTNRTEPFSPFSDTLEEP